MIASGKDKEKALNAVSIRWREEFKEIEKCIEDSASSGAFYVSKSGSIHPRMKRLLEDLGYKVKIGLQYNKPYYTINWK
jgi:hypothetical protein